MLWELGNGDLASVDDARIASIYKLIMAIHDAEVRSRGAMPLTDKSGDFTLDEISEASEIVNEQQKTNS